MTKAMLARLLNESPATEVRARRIILIGDDGVGAELRLCEDDSAVVLALTSEGEEISIELQANVAGPVLILSDSRFTGSFIELGGDYDNDRWGLTLCDGSNTFHWPPLRR